MMCKMRIFSPNNYSVVGEIKKNLNTNEVVYITERDRRKNQIYLYKTNFMSIDGEHFTGRNCIAISLDICRKLVDNKVDNIYFNIRNFPKDMEHFTGKISLQDFIVKSVTIKEEHYDFQRITPIENLQKLGNG